MNTRDIWLSAVLRDQGLRPRAKVVAAVLWRWLGYESLEYAYPGEARLVHECGMSRASVARGIADLIGAQWIGRHKRGELGQRAMYYGRFPDKGTRAGYEPPPTPAFEPFPCPICGALVAAPGQATCGEH